MTETQPLTGHNADGTDIGRAGRSGLGRTGVSIPFGADLPSSAAKQIQDFAVEDLRIMIGQRLGLVHLLPLAVDVLKENPFSEGDFYPGDLLKNVLDADLAAFPDDGTLVREIGAICRAALRDSANMERLDCLDLADFRALIVEFAQRR